MSGAIMQLARRLATCRAPGVADLFSEADLENHGYCRMACDVLALLEAERRQCVDAARGNGRVPLRHGPVIEDQWQAGYLAGRDDAGFAAMTAATNLYARLVDAGAAP